MIEVESSGQYSISFTIRYAANIGLAIWRLKCFYETFMQGSTAVIRLNFCAKNPPLRQAAKRYDRPRRKFFENKIVSQTGNYYLCQNVIKIGTF